MLQNCNKFITLSLFKLWRKELYFEFFPHWSNISLAFDVLFLFIYFNEVISSRDVTEGHYNLHI